MPRGTRIALALVVAGAATGCASLGERPGQIAIASDPPGAEVYAMGRRVGVTPLSIDQRRVFPATYPSEQQALYGMVELRRTGCMSVQRPISLRGVARGVDVKLDCGPGARPAAGAKQAAVTAAPSSTTAAIEARLRQVQELRERGVISEDEALAQRRRILGEL